MEGRKNFFMLNIFFILMWIMMFPSCNTNNRDKKEAGETTVSSGFQENPVTEENFAAVPDSDKPWVYYWWLKGNVTKELITRDLEEMKSKGIGGFLLFDSRGYYDDYASKDHVPVPLEIKHEFMSPGWREMVKFTMQEASRLGLQMSINLANTGGSLRGPWDMQEDGPKHLIWCAVNTTGPQRISLPVETPAGQNYFRDVSLLAVQVMSEENIQGNNGQSSLNENWSSVGVIKGNSPVAGKIIDLKGKVKENTLQWDVPEGKWKIIRFGYSVIGDKGSVDILNVSAVTRYFGLMGAEIIKDAGPLAGKTLTYFYNVSWEGGQPDWTVEFEKEFARFRGYDMDKYMPVLAGMIVGDTIECNRFMRDYLKTVSDCFTQNCYATIGNLCHENGIQWHSENGGPWPRNAPMFKEADQLVFWGRNDMPQGEFWNSTQSDLKTKSNIRYTAMAAHTYGQPLVSVEAFTHMGVHWTMYPAFLKPFADYNFIDGANFFIWHTFTASPLEIGKPGYEYFAGTHINPRITWWNYSGGILGYLGRCQYLLRKGLYVADVCCYVSDKNYVKWGRGEKWNDKSPLMLNKGYSYDLLSTEVLIDRLSVVNGRLTLPDGMNYKVLVVDLNDNQISYDALKKIASLAKEGATIVLGPNKPSCTHGLLNYAGDDRGVIKLATELWGEDPAKPEERMYGKGKIYSGITMDNVLKSNNILPDFEGPFEYMHRNSKELDLYFISGEGEAECTFRVNGKKPEIWNPLNGQVSEALCYRFTEDGRTIVPVKLSANGSAFVIFRKPADQNHFVSVNSPGAIETNGTEGKMVKLTAWESGDYKFTTLAGKTSEIKAVTDKPVELTGSWNVSFKPEKGKETGIVFSKLTLWNENASPEIKYYSGTATYHKTFSLTAEQAASAARLQLGNVFNVAQVWVNDKDLGIVWTAPWNLTITGMLNPGENKLRIEVTNCWANRLIGDAGLPKEKRTTETNVRLVPDRKEYPKPWQTLSAQDPLMPSGLTGPVVVEFGKPFEIEL